METYEEDYGKENRKRKEEKKINILPHLENKIVI